MFKAPLSLALGTTLVAFAPSSFAGNSDLDPSYGGGGFKRELSIYGNYAFAAALQADGRLLLGGWAGTSNGTRDFGILRHLADSTPDTAFGDGTGKVITNFLGSYDQINGMAVTANAVYAAGNRYSGNYPDFALAKYTLTGALDNGFAGTGKVSTSFGIYGSNARAMAMQPDGKIVLVGESYDLLTSNDFVAARFNADGTLDSAFGIGGKLRINVSTSGNDGAWGTAIQPDGKVLMAGDCRNGTADAICVVRLTAAGAVDSGFGTSGIVRFTRTGYGLNGRAMAIQPDGKIVVAGQGTLLSNGTIGSQLVRFTSTGALDTTFNGIGSSFNSYATGGEYRVNAVEVMPTGQILIAGQTRIPAQSVSLFFTARFTGAGALDTAFANGNGYKVGDLGGSTIVNTSAQGIALAPDGKFYVAGYSNGFFGVLRYQGDPVDVAPNPVSFNAVSGAMPSTLQISNIITVSGLSTVAKVPLSISGGTYSINGGPATNLHGYVSNGDQVMVMHTSASTPATSVTTTLKFGGLSAANNRAYILGTQVTATFTSSTP